MTRRRGLSPWPYRAYYLVALVVLGTGFYLAYALGDLKALGPFGTVGAAALILGASDHLTYRRLGGGRK